MILNLHSDGGPLALIQPIPTSWPKPSPLDSGSKTSAKLSIIEPWQNTSERGTRCGGAFWHSTYHGADGRRERLQSPLPALIRRDSELASIRSASGRAKCCER